MPIQILDQLERDWVGDEPLVPPSELPYARRLIFGEGNPNTRSVQGNNEDAYLDYDTGEIYEHNGTRWDGVTTLMKQEGLLFHDRDPQAADGQNGYFWVNTVSKEVFEKDGNGAWQSRVTFGGSSVTLPTNNALVDTPHIEVYPKAIENVADLDGDYTLVIHGDLTQLPSNIDEIEIWAGKYDSMGMFSGESVHRVDPYSLATGDRIIPFNINTTEETNIGLAGTDTEMVIALIFNHGDTFVEQINTTIGIGQAALLPQDGDSTDNVVILDNPSSPVAATAENRSNLLYRGNRLYTNEPVHHVGKTITWRAFATSDLPSGANPANTWGGAFRINPSVTTLAQHTVIYSTIAQHFLRVNEPFANTKYYTGFNVPNFHGQFDTQEQAEAHATAAGQVFSYAGSVFVVDTYSDRAPDTYLWTLYESQSLQFDHIKGRASYAQLPADLEARLNASNFAPSWVRLPITSDLNINNSYVNLTYNDSLVAGENYEDYLTFDGSAATVAFENGTYEVEFEFIIDVNHSGNSRRAAVEVELSYLDGQTRIASTMELVGYIRGDAGIDTFRAYNTELFDINTPRTYTIRTRTQGDNNTHNLDAGSYITIKRLEGGTPSTFQGGGTGGGSTSYEQQEITYVFWYHGSTLAEIPTWLYANGIFVNHGDWSLDYPSTITDNVWMMHVTVHRPDNPGHTWRVTNSIPQQLTFGYNVRFSSDGASWHAGYAPDTDLYISYRESFLGLGTRWSEAIRIGQSGTVGHFTHLGGSTTHVPFTIPMSVTRSLDSYNEFMIKVIYFGPNYRYDFVRYIPMLRQHMNCVNENTNSLVVGSTIQVRANADGVSAGTTNDLSIPSSYGTNAIGLNFNLWRPNGVTSGNTFNRIRLINGANTGVINFSLLGR